MVQRQVVRHIEPTTCHKKTRETTRNIKASKSTSQSKMSKKSQHLTTELTLHMQEKNNQIPGPGETGRETDDQTGVMFTPPVEGIKERKRKERLAKERQIQEDRERFVKEATARKMAEREEIVKRAKRFILFRKPMCRRINRALVISESFRELDAQMKFQETLKTVDKDEEMAYVKLMKADVAKYEEEKKQIIEKELEKQKNYGVMLKKQIEDNERSINAKKKEEFEAEKQDQSDTSKYLQDMKEHEMQELLKRKQKLEQFFKDAIEEKKRFDLKLKHEDEFEDRAIEIYQNAKAQIKKLHKALASREKEEGERRAQLIMEQFRTQMKSSEEAAEQILQKALEEQEARHQEMETARKERQVEMRKELQDFQMETTAMKSKQFQEEKDLKTWEMIQRFRKVECDKQSEAERQRQERNKKIDYGTALTKYISENKIERNRNKILEDDSINVKQIVEKENQKVLNYAEEVLNESNGVRPLYPILKAIQECKKEMSLMPVQKKEEITMDTVPKRRQRVLPKCTKFVPEDQILYLQ